MMRKGGLLLAVAASLLLSAPATFARARAHGPTSASGQAPGGPGEKADWPPADKHGFGTSRSTASNVWFTLEGGELTEVYYPRLDMPSFRDLQFVVTDGHSFAERERDSTSQQTARLAGGSFIYRQINTDRRGRWRLTKTYVTDPSRPTVSVSIHFQSLTGHRYRLYVLADPALDNDGNHDTGICRRGSLLTTDGTVASAILTAPRLREVSCGFKGTSDGWVDLQSHHRLTHFYSSARNGNVVEVGRTALTGTGRRQAMTLVLGFGRSVSAAATSARMSLRIPRFALAVRYQRGWDAYLASLRRLPSGLQTAAERREYRLSTFVLAASEDKTYRGAYVASPTMPWAWGTGLQVPTGPYHLVWARDLYEIATALIADGDVGGARRALAFLFDRQQKPDGSFPQNSYVTGAPALTNLQLDEVADPIILAWQLRETGNWSWQHVKRSADFIVGWHDDQGHAAPYTPQERWENQAGYSPATIASEIAALVCAADIADKHGATADAARYLRTADDWRAHLNSWTLTTTGPYGPAYYLRLTKDGNPNAGTTYDVGDSGPPAIDQRRVVDPSFLELVRLGIIAPNDPNIRSTIGVVDAQLGTTTPTGQFWHRYNGDGYGEQRNGAPWDVGFPKGSQATIGRIWPIFAAERGEYQLAAGQGAGDRLQAVAATANDAGLLPEQVWDDNPPAGQSGFPPGRPTFSATPLAWTHAQLIRLAWSVSAGSPVEQPAVVACRYVRTCH